MGHVYAEIALSNYGDVIDAEKERIDENTVRRTIVNSLVDSGATMLTITPPVFRATGLRPFQRGWRSFFKFFVATAPTLIA